MNDERRIQELIRSLPGPEGEPAIRERLRAEFMAGMPGAENPAVDAAARAARSAGSGGRDGVPDGRRRVIPFRVGLVGLAVAASLLALFFLWPRGPQWTVTGVTGEGFVTVAGATYRAEEAMEKMPSRLPPGTLVSAEGGVMVDLMTPDFLAIQLAPGSEMETPGGVEQNDPSKLVGRVTRGEVRFVTGEKFRGSRLELETAAAQVIVTGTTFAVITDPDTTCVCVLEGTVTMVGPGGKAAAVEGGTRRTLYRGTGEAHLEEILPMERMKLQMLRDTVRSRAAGSAAGGGAASGSAGSGGAAGTEDANGTGAGSGG